ncbi:MAG: SDR family oxidoreductase [Pseudomonadota bacterium]
MDRVIAITGASSGIGEAIAVEAAAAGWRVALAARRADKLDDLVERIGDDRALAIGCDVGRMGDCTRAVETTLERFGRIDAVIANAGLGATVAGVEGGDPENWAEMARTNLLGVAHTAKATLPALRDSTGHFVVMGSVAGRRALKGSFYGATKWGANGYGYNLRGYLAGTGIRVTVVEPGMVDTPFFDEPKPGVLTAGDIAASVLFALSQPPHVEIHELTILPCRRD